MELRRSHVQFQDQIETLKTKLKEQTHEATSLEQQVIDLESAQEKLEDEVASWKQRDVSQQVRSGSSLVPLLIVHFIVWLSLL